MIGDQRAWWGTGVVVVGLGTALLTGTGSAAADTGAGNNASTHSRHDSDAPSTAKSATSSESSTKTGKSTKAERRRTPKAAAGGDSTDSTSARPKSADMTPRSPRTAVVTGTVSTVGAEANKVEANKVTAKPIRPRHGASKNTPAITATADDVAPPSTAAQSSQPATAPAAPTDAVATSPVRLTHGKTKTTPAITPTANDDVAAAPSTVGPSSQPAIARAAPAAATATSPQPTEIIQTMAAVRSLVAPVANAPTAPRPLAILALNLLSELGWTPRPAAVAAFPALAAWSSPTAAGAAPAASVVSTSTQPAVLSAPSTDGVTGVRVGHANLDIPLGTNGYSVAADWYFPTQADGSVQANGVIWLQHGFLGDKSWYSALATQLAQQTNSVVVAPNVSSFALPGCADCTLNSVPLQQAVGTMFLGDRSALNASADAAGFQGTLPEKFILTGHSAGGGLATTAAGSYTDAVAPADNDLLGVVMFDGVSSNDTFAPALASLDTLNIPVYQIAAPPQPWNANGQTTNDLVALRPGQFVGAVLANGSHVDSLIGGVPLIDCISQLVIKPSPPGNTAAVYTLATGWINDMYAGKGSTDPQYGIYGQPDQLITMGPTAAVVLGPPPVVDVNNYLGTWYEVGSVKQFFSIGLVNTTAVYSLNPDGSIRVENSGNYFVNNGPESNIVGSAVPVDPANNKLNVSFSGPASPPPPGNYWIVDLAPDYSWAIVTDSTGSTGFLLSRTPTVSDQLYQELLDRASVKGVNGSITRTPQPAAGQAMVAV